MESLTPMSFAHFLQLAHSEKIIDIASPTTIPTPKNTTIIIYILRKLYLLLLFFTNLEMVAWLSVGPTLGDTVGDIAMIFSFDISASLCAHTRQNVEA